MKKILAVLLAFVFLQVESRAYAPDYGGLGLNPVGTYGGTMTPLGTDTTTAADGVADADSLGLFSLGVPQIGLSNGSFAVFVEGAAYVGTIVGYVDPTTQAYSAILSGDSLFTIPVAFSNGTTVTVVFQPISISGNMLAVFAQTIVSAGAGSSTTITGTATLVSFYRVNTATGAPIPTATQTFNVNGVQQSGTVNPSTITLTAVSNGGS